MSSAHRRPLRKLALLLDGVLVVLSMLGARGVHGLLREHFEGVVKARIPFEEYARLVYLLVPFWLLLIASLGLHRVFERRWTKGRLAWDLLKLHFLGFVGVTFAAFVTQTVINRSLVFAFFGVSFLVMFTSRSLLDRWQRYQHAVGNSRERILLVGRGGKEMADFAQLCMADPFPPLIVGYLGEPADIETEEMPKRLGDLDLLEDILHEGLIDRVLFLPPHNRPEDLERAIAACETVGVTAELAVDLPTKTQAMPQIVQRAGHPFVAIDVSPKPPDSLALKHAFDFVAALLGIIVLSPILLLIALSIWLTMGRPIFFSQERAGLYGRRFKMIKFRTMVVDAEKKRDELLAQNEMSGPVFKVTNDPRITPLGRFLRRSSLDELPQLFNVLLGEMSLVGPRPLPTKEQQAISGWHRRRLSMRPGITGLWQVSGRSNIDFDQWMKLDLRYIDGWSLMMDLKILLKTLPAVLFAKGAK